MIVGVVLAGGRSSRFGRDKLAEPIDGQPLLWRPIRALAAAGCHGVVVVIGPAGPEPELPADLDPAPPDPGAARSPVGRDRPFVAFSRDPEPFGGPLVGLRSALATIGALDLAVALVVGGDQPTLEPAVLGDLARRVRAGSAAAVLADGDGVTRPLPFALDVARGLDAADRLLAAGRRRLRDLIDDLGAEVVERVVWSSLDPVGTTLADIDEPGDLVRPDPGQASRPSS